MKGPLKKAYDDAVAAAVGFAREHPVWTTLIALGILVILLPWVIEALGFGEAGPVAGMSFDHLFRFLMGEYFANMYLLLGRFAAWWMRRYAGYVPKRSLYAFFQRLGMVWKRHVGLKGVL